MIEAYIGLGANLGDAAQQLRDALAAIENIPRTTLHACSSLYRSAPMGPPEQPDYCNAVCRVNTALTPRALLEALIDIERAAGRIRGGERWGPRVLDLDLLHVVGVALDEPGLRLPHRGLMQRNFVVVPLAELAPSLDIPGLGEVATRAAQIGCEGLRLWTEASAT